MQSSGSQAFENPLESANLSRTTWKGRHQPGSNFMARSDNTVMSESLYAYSEGSPNVLNETLPG